MAKNSHIKAFKKHINVLGLINAVLITLIANYALVYVLSLVINDWAWQPLATFLIHFDKALITVANYVMYGLLINSLLRFGFKKSGGILSISILRIVLIHLATMFFGLFMSEDFVKDIRVNFYYVLIEAMIEIVLLLGAIILIMFLRSKYIDEKKTNITINKFIEKGNPLLAVTLWVSILISVVYLAGDFAETYALIRLYGTAGMTFKTVMNMAMPYINQIFVFVLGYAVMVGVAKWLDLQWSGIVSSDKPKRK